MFSLTSFNATPTQRLNPSGRLSGRTTRSVKIMVVAAAALLAAGNTFARKAWDAVCSAASMRPLSRILQRGRTLMPAPHIVETKSRQTSPARPKLRCTWHLDPTSGRPVARWALEQSEPIRSGALRSAA